MKESPELSSSPEVKINFYFVLFIIS